MSIKRQSPLCDFSTVAPETSAEEAAADLIEIRLWADPQYEGWRMDRFVQARIPRLSRNRIQQMLRAQQTLGGQALRPSTRVRGGTEVVLLRPAPKEPDVPRTFDILHQDAHLLAIAKPPGLPVHATARFHRNTLTAVLREHFAPQPAPALAHRLDRETSGLMLLGRTSAASVALKEAFAHRAVKKTYLALVHGRPPAEGTIDYPLGADTTSGIRVKMGVVSSGLPALTRFRVREYRGEHALVEAYPETGRQHQIRVHLAAIGCPVVGDKLYGQSPDVWIEYLELGWTPRLAQLLSLRRHALHAAEAVFPHPADGQPTHLRCPWPEDLQTFWDSLRP